MVKDSASVTFRLSNDDLEMLRLQAEEEKTSVNTLVNKILQNHNKWQRNCIAAGFMPIHRAILGRLIDTVDENTLREIAIQSADEYTDSLLLMQGDAGLESALALLIRWSRASGFVCKAFSPNHAETRRKSKTIIQHYMGAKWSMFLKEYIQQIIHNTGHGVQIDVNSNSIVIEVDAESSGITEMLYKDRGELSNGSKWNFKDSTDDKLYMILKKYGVNEKK